MQQKSSVGKSKYFVLIFDNHFRYYFIFLIKENFVLFQIFQNWLAMAEHQIGQIPQILRLENGSGYVSSEMRSFLHKRVVLQRKSRPLWFVENGQRKVEKDENRRLEE